MDATSARFAARDRWAEAGAHHPPSQLQRFIQGACSPENVEPNLGLNLEISDLINAKKGSAPREAALAIVNYVNHRNPNVALLALGLLDICVKNCGYPFHLQISTKDFLNELVRRFPERPPIRPTRVQAKILEAIEEWRSTICETSRYKEDLGFVRDMHRLLSYKGYSFPEVRREDVAVLNPSDNLKSAEEMEEEDREAQSAKLQELIRRGSPEDLQEANRLMKVMAGFDTRSKTDYRAKAAEEVGKIQAKARLLEERLEGFRPEQGDKMVDGDVFSELALALRNAQPKIQKMCEEESDDHEAVAKLLEINDSIHRTVQRYGLMRKGNVDEARKIASGSVIAPSSGSGPGRGAHHTNSPAEISLIDFDADMEITTAALLSSGPAAAAPARLPSSTSIEDDLLGLSMGESSGGAFGQSGGGGIALGFGANANVPGPALLSSITQDNSARGALTTTPPPYAPFASLTSAPASGSGTPQPAAAQQQTPSFNIPHAQAARDPFAALGSLTLRPSPSPSPRPGPPQPAPPAKAAADDDEWSYSSALPAETMMGGATKEHRGIVTNSELKIEFVAMRAAGKNSISLSFAFTNNTPHPVTELHYQLAVTKGYELQLKPQTGRTLEPSQSRAITQEVEVWHMGDRDRKVNSIKLRWLVTYKVGAEDRKDMGDIAEFTIA